MRSRRRVRNGSGVCRPPRRRIDSGGVADVVDLREFAKTMPRTWHSDSDGDVNVGCHGNDMVAGGGEVIEVFNVPSSAGFARFDAANDDDDAASNTNDFEGGMSPLTEPSMERETDSEQASLRPSIHQRRRFTSRNFAGLDIVSADELLRSSSGASHGATNMTSPWACEIDTDDLLPVPPRRMMSMPSVMLQTASSGVDSEDSDADSVCPLSTAKPRKMGTRQMGRRRVPSLDWTDGEESDDGSAIDTSLSHSRGRSLKKGKLPSPTRTESSPPVFNQVVVYGAFLVADMFQAIATTKRGVVSPWFLCIMVLLVAMVIAPLVKPVAERLRGLGAASALMYCGLRVLLNTWDTHNSSSEQSSILDILLGRCVAATASNLLFFTIVNGSSIDAAKEFYGWPVVNKVMSSFSSFTASGSSEDKQPPFTAFRLHYLVVHGSIMLADGLQGTHLYVLYEGYGYSVASLYSLGFVSGAITAPFIGPLVDRMGRKKAAMLYCALEVIINVMEQFPLFAGLVASRVIGGMTTNLLFSVFESWLVTEHRRRGFGEEKLEVLLRDSVIASNLAAIVSGYVAHWLAAWLGPVGPFEGAVTATAVALVLVATMWRENYGASNFESVQSVHSYLTGAFKTITSHSKISRLGLIQGLTEGSLQTFVFLWSPALRKFAESAPSPSIGLDENGSPTYGLIFGAFMACGVLGGLAEPLARHALSALLNSWHQRNTSHGHMEDQNNKRMNHAEVQLIVVLCYTLCAGCLSVPFLVSAQNPDAFSLSLGAFLIYEFLVGLYMPCEGVVRSIYMPNNSMCSLMTMLRVIVNIAVAVGVISTNYIAFESAFVATTVLMIISACFQFSLISRRDLLRLQVGQSTEDPVD